MSILKLVKVKNKEAYYDKAIKVLDENGIFPCKNVIKAAIIAYYEIEIQNYKGNIAYKQEEIANFLQNHIKNKKEFDAAVALAKDIHSINNYINYSKWYTDVNEADWYKNVYVAVQSLIDKLSFESFFTKSDAEKYAINAVSIFFETIYKAENYYNIRHLKYDIVTYVEKLYYYVTEKSIYQNK